jgi:hypothetical protein
VIIPPAIHGVAVTEIAAKAFSRGLTDARWGWDHPSKEYDEYHERYRYVNVYQDKDVFDYAMGAPVWRTSYHYSFRKEEPRSTVPVTSVVIPDTVTVIGNDAFRENPLLSVQLPKGLTRIGDRAFEYCGSLETVDIPDSVIAIGEDAFYGCGLTSVSLGKSLERIGVRAFRPATEERVRLIDGAGKNRLTELRLPASLKEIGEGAFDGNALASLTIPGGVLLLGKDCFGDNPLATVTIPASLGRYATYGNSTTAGFAGAFPGGSVTRITLPANVAEQNMEQFDVSLVNFWKSQNKRAGTYYREGPIWKLQ